MAERKTDGMVRCGNCGSVFHQDHIVMSMTEDNRQIEHCPDCNATGCLVDLSESEVEKCPKEST